MQLVKDQEIQINSAVDDLPISLTLPRHEQFEHHEVSQQDVRLSRADAVALVVSVLTGVPRAGWQQGLG